MILRCFIHHVFCDELLVLTIIISEPFPILCEIFPWEV